MTADEAFPEEYRVPDCLGFRPEFPTLPFRDDADESET